MKYLAAYALLSLSGKKDIITNDIKHLLTASNIAFNDKEITTVITALKAKTIHQLIAQGNSLIVAPVPTSKPPKIEASKPKKKENPKLSQAEQDFEGMFD